MWLKADMLRRLLRGRTAIRPQFQTTECGVGVLRTMLAYFGAEIPACEVRRITGVSRDCLNAGDLRRAAHALGMNCTARSVEVETLLAMKLPLVVHLRFIHFVVLEAINGRHATINCPAAGHMDMTIEEFGEAFTGITLSLSPGAGFGSSRIAAPSEIRWWTLLFAQVWLEVCGLAFLSAVRALALVALAVRIDRPGFLLVRSGLALALILIASAGMALLFRSTRQRLYHEMRNSMAAKFDRVAHSFYVYRLPDVLLESVSNIEQLCDTLTDKLLPAAAAGVEAGVLLGACALVHLRAALPLLTVFAIWMAGVAWLSIWRRRDDPYGESSGTDGPHAAAKAFKTPEHVRLGDGPDCLALLRAGTRAATWRARLRVGVIHAMLARGPLALLVLSMLGVCLLEIDHLAAPLLIAGALSFIAAPSTRLRGVTAQMRRQAFAIRDVLDEPEPGPAEPAETPRGTELRLEGVTFRFNASRPPILHNASLIIAPGEHIGITGASGGGKSTATEIMMGLHEPETGAVLLGGVLVSQIQMSNRSRLIARVDRRPILFEATIRENLTLNDPSITDADLESAIEDAALKEVIAQLPHGLDTWIEFEGRNFSGGQLQRIEIARALTRHPSIVILDDAVDALDFALEMQIRTALRARRCTVICVSHRASSLAACDRQVVFREGQFYDPAASQSDILTPATRIASPGIFHALADDHPGHEEFAADAPLLRQCWTYLSGRVVPDGVCLQGETAAAMVGQLAKATETQVRPIRFTVASWWLSDLGRVLGFRTDGSPVAILGGPFRTRLFDPRTGAQSLLSKHEIARLRPDAYAFLPAPERARDTLGAKIASAIRSTQRDAVLTGLFSLCAAACVTLLFGISGRIAALPLTLLLAAAVLFGTQARVASERSEFSLKETEDVQTDDLALRCDADAARRLDIAIIFRALQGMNGLVRQTKEFLGRSMFALGLVSFGATHLVVCGANQSSARFLLAGLLCAVLPVFGALAELPLQEAALSTRLAARRRLYATLCGMARFRSLDRAAECLRRWAHVDDGALARMESLHRVERALRPLIAVCPALAVAFVLDTKTSASQTAASLWLMVFGFLEIGEWLASLLRDRARHRAASELLSIPREEGLRKLDTASAVLRLQDVSFGYGGRQRPLLAGLSLCIDPRQMTVLAGASGSGKSTLLRMLLGLQQPLLGEISVGGVPMREIDLAYWRRGIAGIFQGDCLEDAVTIRAQLSPSLSASLAEILDVLDVVEMASEVQQMPMGVQTIVEVGRISNGQQQRLLIARALLTRPSLLILDEATNAIPDALQARIFARTRERGIGCLVVSHRESVWAIADIVHVLGDGTVDSNPSRLLTLRPNEHLRTEEEVESL